MIEHVVSNNDSILEDIRLFKCNDEDVTDVLGHIYLKNDDDDEVEFSIKSTKDLETQLIKIGKRIEQDSFAKRVLLDIEVFIYQYKNKFAIQFNTTSKTENLAKLTIGVLDQLIKEYND